MVDVCDRAFGGLALTSRTRQWEGNPSGIPPRTAGRATPARAAYLAEHIGEVPVLMIRCVEVIDGDGTLTGENANPY
jgi:hypothetical protein